MPRMSRPKASAAGSKKRLFSAAAHEFAAVGFAGASVDRIARGARVNKAMIYYHFASKAALYREILRDMFEAVATRVGEIARSQAAPPDKIRAFVEAIASEAEARPHFPPIWFREIADGGRHLDAHTTRHITGVIRMLGAIIAEGVTAKRFHPVNPFLVHSGIVGPLLLYFATAEVRKRVTPRGAVKTLALDRSVVVAHVQRLALATLEERA